MSGSLASTDLGCEEMTQNLVERLWKTRFILRMKETKFSLTKMPWARQQKLWIISSTRELRLLAYVLWHDELVVLEEFRVEMEDKLYSEVGRQLVGIRRSV